MVKMRLRRKRTLPGSYTVEAAGVMAVVLFTIMVLLNQAFHVRAETVGVFSVHETAERERHALEYLGEKTINRRGSGMRWSLDLTVPVFRPEESLRLWSLMEEKT